MASTTDQSSFSSLRWRAETSISRIEPKPSRRATGASRLSIR